MFEKFIDIIIPSSFIFIISLIFSCIIYRKDSEGNTKYNRIVTLISGSIISMLIFSLYLIIEDQLIDMLNNVFNDPSSSISFIFVALILFLFHFFMISLVDMKLKMKSKKEYFRDHKNMTFLVLYSLIIVIFIQLERVSIVNFFIIPGSFIFIISLIFSCIIYRKDSEGNTKYNRIVTLISGSIISMLIYFLCIITENQLIRILDNVFNAEDSAISFILVTLIFFLFHFFTICLVDMKLKMKSKKEYFRDHENMIFLFLYSLIITIFIQLKKFSIVYFFIIPGSFIFIISLIFFCIIYRKDSKDNTKYNRIVALISGSIISMLIFFLCVIIENQLIRILDNVFNAEDSAISFIFAVLIFFLFHFFAICLVDMKFKMKSKKEYFRDHENKIFLVLYSFIITIFIQFMLSMLDVIIIPTGVFWRLFIILVVLISFGFAHVFYGKDLKGSKIRNQIIFSLGGILTSFLSFMVYGFNVFNAESSSISIIFVVLILFLFHFFIISLVDMKLKMKSKKNYFRDHKNMIFLVLYSFIITIFIQLERLSIVNFFIIPSSFIFIISLIFSCIIYRKDSEGSTKYNRIVALISGSIISILIFFLCVITENQLIRMLNEVDFIILALFCFLIHFIIMSILNVVLYKKKGKNYLRDYKSIALTALYSVIVTVILVLLLIFLMTGM